MDSRVQVAREAEYTLDTSFHLRFLATTPQCSMSCSFVPACPLRHLLPFQSTYAYPVTLSVCIA